MKSQRLKTLIFGSILFLICATIILFGFISQVITFLKNAGVNPEIIYLTQTLPFIGLFIAIFRIVIGINVPNISVPVILILTSFILGLGLTLEVFAISLILAYLAKYIINQFHLHLAVKSSLIITLVTIGLIMLLPFLRNSTLFTSNNSHLVIVYGLLIVSVINEKFLSSKMTRHNLLSDLGNILKTIFFAVISFLILGGKFSFDGTNIQEWTALKSIIIAFPDTIFLAFILTLAIGRYTGLRISEVIRFRKLIFKNR